MGPLIHKLTTRKFLEKHIAMGTGCINISRSTYWKFRIAVNQFTLDCVSEATLVVASR